MTPTISSLLSRVRAASGPDRVVDAQIDAALFGGRAARDFTGDDPASRLRVSYEAHAVFDHLDPMVNGGHVVASMLRHAPAYTASIDAAVALVERVLPGWQVERRISEGRWFIRLLGPEYSRYEFKGPYNQHCTACFPTSGFAEDSLAILAALLSALEQKERAE